MAKTLKPAKKIWDCFKYIKYDSLISFGYLYVPVFSPTPSGLINALVTYLNINLVMPRPDKTKAVETPLVLGKYFHISNNIGKNTNPHEAPDNNIATETILISGNKINVELHKTLIASPMPDIVKEL